MSILISKILHPKVSNMQVDIDLHALSEGCTLLKRDGAAYTPTGVEGGFSQLIKHTVDASYVVRLPDGRLYPLEVER